MGMKKHSLKQSLLGLSVATALLAPMSSTAAIIEIPVLPEGDVMHWRAWWGGWSDDGERSRRQPESGQSLV